MPVLHITTLARLEVTLCIVLIIPVGKLLIKYYVFPFTLIFLPHEQMPLKQGTGSGKQAQGTEK